MTQTGQSAQVRDRAQPVGSGLRSPVWLWLAQGFLVVLYGLVPAVVQQFLLDTLGESLLWRRLGQVLGWLSYAVIAVAIAYAVYHAYVVIRARRRDLHDLQLTADLTAPGRPVKLVARYRPDDADAELPDLASDQGRRLLSGLWPLREHALGIDAVLAVQAALSEASDRLPLRPPSRKDQAAGEPVRQDTAIRVVQTLLDDGYLRLLDGARLKISAAVTEAKIEPPDDKISSYALATAVPALLQHYADLSTRWARALDTRTLGAGATRWFETEATLLHALVTSKLTHQKRRSVVVERARIADALDSWYARTNQPERAEELAAWLYELTAVPAGSENPVDEARERRGGTRLPTYPIVTELARIRGGGDGKPIKCKPRAFAAALGARESHRQAMKLLTTALAEQPRDIAAWKDIEDLLEHAWWQLPREDIAGEVSTLVNLAIVHLHQGRLEAAEDRLELAESLTRGDRDPDGRAHAFEIRGVVSWAEGRQRQAVTYWQRAYDLYGEVDDSRGVARCLQHLGSALVVMPELGDLVVDERVALTEATVKQQAVGWLEAAAEKLGRSEVTDLYLDRADALGASPAAGPCHPPRPFDRQAEPSGAQWLAKLLSDLPGGGKR